MNMVKKHIKVVVSKLGIFLLTLSILLSNYSFVDFLLDNGVVVANASSADVGSEYGFSPRFISGVTTVQKVNASYYDFNQQDLWAKNFKSSDFNRFYYGGTYYISRLTSSNKNARMGIRYNNVGTHDGQIVDMELTATVGSITSDVGYCTSDGVYRYSYPMICFETTNIGVTATHRSTANINVTCRYYAHGTSTPLNIKSHFSLVDIDPSERFSKGTNITNSKVGSHVISSGGYLQSLDPCSHGNTSSSTVTENTPEHQATLLTSGTSFSFTYGHTYDNPTCSSSTRSNKCMYSFFLVATPTLFSFDTPSLYKYASKSVIYPDEMYQYSFNIIIPDQPSSSEYTSLTIKDELQDEITLANDSLSVKDDGGVDVSNRFSLSQDGQNIEINCSDLSWLKNSAKYKGYIFTINVKTKDGYKFTPDADGVVIKNTATITTNYGTKTSNEVETEVKFKIDTKLTGKGTITSLTGYDGGSGSILDIKGGTSETVTWQAANGYYISSVTIDGFSQTIDDVYSGSHTFSDINSNHSVEVVTLPRPQFIISKTADKPYYNGGDTINFTISFKLKENTSDKAENVIFKDVDLTEGVTIDKNSIMVTGLEKSQYTLDTSSDDSIFSLSIPTLNKDDTVTVTYSGTVENEFVDSLNEAINNNINNTAKITCDNIITTGENSMWESSKSETPVLKPTITIVKESDKETYNVGDIITYQITVEQTKENAIANNVVITDKDYTNGIKMVLNSEDDVKVTDASGTPLQKSFYEVLIENKSSFTVKIKTLEYNAPVIISVSGIITDEHLAGEYISNKAEAKCDNNSKPVESTTTSVVYKPNLTIIKTVDRDDHTYNVKDNVIYTIQVDQTVSDARANYVVIEDTLPEGMLLDENSIKVYKDSISEETMLKSGYTVTNITATTFTVNIDELNTRCFIVYSANVHDNKLAGNDVTNVAVAQASNFFEKTENNGEVNHNAKTVTDDETISILKPEIEINKVSDKDFYNVGNSIKYSIEVKQLTPSARANDLIVTDTLPEEVKLNKDSIEVSVSSDVTIAEDGKSFTVALKQGLTDSFTITYSAVVEDPALAGQEIVNVATVDWSNNPNNDHPTAQDVSPVLLPKITVEKSADKDFYNVNDTINYVITVSQITEFARANDVVITDVLPDGIKLNKKSIKVSVFSNVEVVEDGKSFTVVLKEGLTDSFTITYSAVIEDPSLAGQEIVNVATVDWSNNPRNEQPTAHTISPVLLPVIKVTKVVDFPEIACNVRDVVPFEIQVEQLTENAVANDVVIEDRVLVSGTDIDISLIKVFDEDGNLLVSNSDYEVIDQYDQASGKSGFDIKLAQLSSVVNITYDVKVNNNNVAGKSINNIVTVSASNNQNETPSARSDKAVLEPILIIKKEIENEYYNVGDIVKFVINTAQTVESANAFDVVIEDNMIEDGVQIDYDTVKIYINDTEFSLKNFDENIISFKKTDRGFIINLKQPLTDKDIVKITYNGKIISNELSGHDFSNDVIATWSNSPDYPNGTQTTATSNVIKPEIILEKNIVNNDSKVFNLYDIVDYTISAKIDHQKTPNARANNARIEDIIQTEGVELIPDSISIDEYAEGQYVLDINDNGFVVTGININDGEVLTIHYSAKITDPKLMNNPFDNEVVLTCDNTPNEFIDIEEGFVTEPALSIEKVADKDIYNLYGTVHFNVKVTQTVEDAVAYGTTINDSFINEGIKIDPSTIVVENYNEFDYSIEFTGNGYEITFNVPLKYGEEINISYDAKIVDPALVGSILTHEVYTSCVTNTDSIGVWKDDIEIKVLAPEVIVDKSSDKSEVYENYKVHYTIVVSQIVQDAKIFNLVVDDVIEDNMSIDTDSIIISSSDAGMEISSIKIVNNKDGFTIEVPEMDCKNSVTIAYDAVALNAVRKTSTNVVTVTGDALTDAIKDETTINILKTIAVNEPDKPNTPKTGETNIAPALCAAALVSLVTFSIIAYGRKRIK